MSAIKMARRTLPALVIAAAAFFGRAASAQSPVSTVDSARVTVTAGGMDTVHVKAGVSKSRTARERDLIAGNRFLAKELKRYDKRIAELEKRLDSLRIEAAHRWKDAREMEAAALAARERRLEMERRLAMLESDTVSTRRSAAAADQK